MGLSWMGAAEQAAQLLATVDASAIERIAQKVDVRLFSVSARDRILDALQKAFKSSSGPLRRIQLLLMQSELGVTSVPQLKEELGRISGGFGARLVHFTSLKRALEIVQANDGMWVSTWVTGRVMEGAVWDETLLKLITSVPDDIKKGLIERLEGEDFKHSPPRNIIDVLVAGADTALAKRVFQKLCEIRRIITAAPNERHDFEFAVERQLEALLRAIPASIAFTAFSHSFEAPADQIQLDVITRVFSNLGRSETDPLDDLISDMREKLRMYLKRAIATMVQGADLSGELMAHVASVLASVGAPADTPDLRELIRADIARFSTARAARARGVRGQPGNATSHAMWHVKAVMRIDPLHWDSVLLDFLDDYAYENIISQELARLFAPPKLGLMQKLDYDKIWEARSGVRGAPTEQQSHCASAIKARIELLLVERALAELKRPYEFRLRSLAVALAACDSHGLANLVFEVMSIPDEWSIHPRVAAIETLFSNGVALPTERTLSILDSCLDRRYGFQEQEVWVFGQLLCLLPFVDDPGRGIQKIQELMSQSRVRTDQLPALFEAVGHSRCAAGLPFLREIATAKPLAGHLGEAWVSAVAALDIAESQDLLLTFVDPDLPEPPMVPNFERGNAIVTQIVEMMRRDKSIEHRVFQFCGLDLPVARRVLLARIVSQFGTLEAFSAGLELIDDRANPSIPYEITQQIEAAFVARRPYPGSENSYTLEPQRSNEVRTKLLEMTSKDERRKNSAFQLLAQIEEWRLEFGRPPGEPRHPAFESGMPWPFMPKGT